MNDKLSRLNHLKAADFEPKPLEGRLETVEKTTASVLTRLETITSDTDITLNDIAEAIMELGILVGGTKNG